MSDGPGFPCNLIVTFSLTGFRAMAFVSPRSVPKSPVPPRTDMVRVARDFPPRGELSSIKYRLSRAPATRSVFVSPRRLSAISVLWAASGPAKPVCRTYSHFRSTGCGVPKIVSRWRDILVSRKPVLASHGCWPEFFWRCALSTLNCPGSLLSQGFVPGFPGSFPGCAYVKMPNLATGADSPPR